MKSKKSITKKLFIITIIVFIIFITITLIVQSLFFEKFYISTKKQQFKNSLVDFNFKYDKISNNEQTKELIESFQDQNNFKIVIQNKKGDLKYITRGFNRKVDSKAKKIYEFIVEQFDQKDIISRLKQNSESVIIEVTKKKDVVNGIVGVVYNERKDEFIYGFSSLQPVNEATMVIRKFYVYFYIGAIFIIVILSFIYSNMITKPLKRVTKTALKMAKLDFTEKCDIKSDDEIGELSKSLNFLSENLDNTLTSLKGANLKLEGDIEKERKLTEMRKNFVAAVSHELKTPITLIEGYAEALNDDVVEAEEKQYFVDVILDEADKMGNLVSDMLDLSQLESGNFNLVKEKFYLEELIKVVSKKFLSIISKKQITLELKLLKNIEVNADWDRIEQVVTNYLTNAIRHTYDNGSISVVMKEQKDFIIVEVENVGDKLEQNQIENVWDCFYKVDKSRNRKLGGTGIGLSIVKNIILLHGGNVGVENTERGVKFKFSIKKLNLL